MNGQAENPSQLTSVQSVKARIGIKKNGLTQRELKSVLLYDKVSGIFTWRVDRCRKKANSMAGGISEGGYIQLTVFGNIYYAHRLAFLYVQGYFPENDIDHINRDRTDNRYCNLREVSRQCNLRNGNISIKNKSGVKGVHWSRISNKWTSQIAFKETRKHLGLYTELIDAVYARFLAEQCLGYPVCDSNSSAKKFIDKYKNRII